ncbi:MAG: hypothetical protein IPM38_10775 [Ignavibacteria bacterium]|nr:hypothetical protein [Ignavibacteria bacterium]
MSNLTNRFGFIFALLVSAVILFACGDKKESEVTKESTKEETSSKNTKEETKSSSGANQLYFVEEYSKEGQEIGKSEKFFIGNKGGYITAMLKTSSPIGVGSVDVRLERESLDGTEIIDTKPYDVFPDKSYFFFDKITFYKPGDYTVTVFKKDGSPIATGKVRIDLK